MIDDNLFLGEIGTVEVIKGNAYFIRFANTKDLIRMKNGMMEEYFDILDEGKKIEDLYAKELLKSKQLISVILKKDLIIKDVIIINTGTEFYANNDVQEKNIRFWNLFDRKTYERLLRLRGDEFELYFK